MNGKQVTILLYHWGGYTIAYTAVIKSHCLLAALILLNMTQRLKGKARVLDRTIQVEMVDPNICGAMEETD